MVLFALSALTVALGSYITGLSYYVVITLVLIYSLVAFFIRFEGETHRERELVMISIMCAIAVASRVAFIWVPHFKPMAAIVMIAGIGLGARSGFLVGTLSVFISNLIFGQGPWTPWQMISFGLAGLLIGALADARVIPRHGLSKAKVVILAILGALEVLLISGPVLDIYAITSMFNVLTVESAVSILLAGLPINAIQASATFLTLLFLANPLLKAIYRARVKYGMALADEDGSKVTASPTDLPDGEKDH